MTVQQVINMAKASELNALAVKDDDNVILEMINLGLIELYKRFPLKVDEAIITLVDGRDVYSLDGNDANVQMGNTDYMSIVAAYGEVNVYDLSIGEVKELPINEEDNILSVNTVGWNSVQVPASLSGNYVSIIYTAAPKYLTIADISDSIPVPPQMVEALLHYVGYRAHSAVDGEINSENTTHYTRFEASCNRVLALGLFGQDDMYMTNRVKDRGFV